MREPFRPPLALALVVALGGGAASACARSAETGPQIPKSAKIVRDTEIRHEPCDLSKAEKLSARGDKAELFLVSAGGREVCRGVDFDRDGRIDTYVYLDPAGQVRRRESDYDRDGRIDDIMIYKGGVLVERHQATTLRGRLDTWSFYEGGRLVRTERDSDGDAAIDQWWEYPKDPECPMIHSDFDGDGRPDPGTTIDYCKETGYVPPERAADRKPESPNFQKPTDMPVELDSKEQGGETPATEKKP